jgi:hypothetical protein
MKNIEEAAISLEYNVGVIMSNPIEIAKISFVCGFQFAQQWIPVEEELPKTDDHSDPIEMKLENGVIVSGYRFSDGDWLQHDEFGHGKVIKTKVTHWRPIELK